jgi:hypothetical protein
MHAYEMSYKWQLCLEEIAEKMIIKKNVYFNESYQGDLHLLKTALVLLMVKFITSTSITPGI